MYDNYKLSEVKGLLVMNINVKYELRRITSTKTDKYVNAMKLYTQNIDFFQKTNTNEIGYWVNNTHKFKDGELLFLALISNDILIGYAELSYMKRNRIVIIDYLLIDNKYKSNSAFYTFFGLIIEYLSKNEIDYDFITKEIFCKYDNVNLYKSEISIYELENFKVANCLYIQPQLELSNAESEKEALLMIYQKATTASQLKKETYLYIVKTIYEYYQIWDEPFIKYEKNIYYEKYNGYMDSIIETIKDEHYIVMNGYPNTHTYASSDKGIPQKGNKSIRNAIVYTSIVTVIVIGILFAVKELNVELTSVAVVSIAVLFIILSFVALSDSKGAKIIKNLPVFSKLFELLK